MRLEWESNPRMAVLQTAALDHFAIEPFLSDISLSYLSCKLASTLKRS